MASDTMESGDALKAAIERANTAFNAKLYGEASGIAEDILADIPEHPAALALLGAVAHSRHEWARAVELLSRSIEVDPPVEHARHVTLASALRQLNRIEEALAASNEAMRLAPNNPDVFIGHALILTDVDEWEQSTELLLMAIGLQHQSAMAHLALSQNLLAHGEYDAGWREYEWRILTAPENWPRFTSAPWNGMRLPGKLLVIGDQGFGDVIQFSRYLPMAAELCEELILNCDAALVPLLRNVPGVSRATNDWREVGTHAAHVRLSSLPYLMQTKLDTIPPAVPFAIDPELCAKWDEQLPAHFPRVGLAWCGRSTHANHVRRTLNLSQVIPLGEVAPAHFVSLQKPFPEHDRPYQTAFRGLREMPLTNFADTAALIANLDLVITIDTSVAHLAGTLGVPTWVMLPKPNDWRWLLNRSDSPWYPSVRLFRQKTPGGWDEVIHEVAQALSLGLTREARQLALG